MALLQRCTCSTVKDAPFVRAISCPGHLFDIQMHSLCSFCILMFFQNGEYLTCNRTHFAHLLAPGTLSELHLRFARGIELFESTGVASPDALGFAVYVLVFFSRFLKLL